MSGIEHKQPIFVGFFVVQYAKLRTLELYYNFFYKYYDATTFEEPDMDTVSLSLALSEQDLYVCIKPAMKKDQNFLRNEDCTIEFSANSPTNCFPHTCCAKHKKHDRHRRDPDLFKEGFCCTEMICLCSKTYCFFDSQSN